MNYITASQPVICLEHANDVGYTLYSLRVDLRRLIDIKYQTWIDSIISLQFVGGLILEGDASEVEASPSSISPREAMFVSLSRHSLIRRDFFWPINEGLE